jgi:hypothetical protein
MKSFIATVTIASVFASPSDNAQCSKMPAAADYTLKGVEAAVTPVSSLNGNWVLYGVPTGEGDEVTAAAPKSCTHKADGETPLEFGAEVDMSCCDNGSAS